MKPSQFDKTVIEIICVFRKRAREKQSNISSLLQITQPEYSKIENGTRALALGQLETICNYLNLSLEAVIRLAHCLESTERPDEMNEVIYALGKRDFDIARSNIKKKREDLSCEVNDSVG